MNKKTAFVEPQKIYEAIDFFTQVLHPEQLEYYGYEYLHEALGFESSLLWMKDDESMVLKGVKGCEIHYAPFVITHEMSLLATKVGVVLTKGLESYLPEYLLETYQPNILIPLISADELIGMIVSNSWKGQDPVYADTLKKLINNAFYSGIQTQKNINFKEQTDRKHYNQMLMNRLMAMTLTELDLNKLIQGCVEGIREMTASSKTSFWLLDDYSGKMTLRYYEDLISYNKTVGAISFKDEFPLEKLTYSFEDEVEKISCFFEDMRFFEKLEPKYITFIKRDRVIGFVTMSETISGRAFDDTLIEPVENILAVICAAIDNAKYLMLLERQKNQIDKSWSALTQITKSIKTINSAADLDELWTLTFQCLDQFSGVSEVFTAFKTDQGDYEIRYGTISELIGKRISLRNSGIQALKRGLLMDHRPGSFHTYITGFDGETSDFSTVVAPIDIVRLEMETDGPFAIMAAVGFKSQFLQYESNYFEALASSIAPLVWQMTAVAQISTKKIYSEPELFLETLRDYEAQKQKYWMDYKVYYKPWVGRIFEDARHIKDGPNIFKIGSKLCRFAFDEECLSTDDYEASVQGTPEEIIEALESLCS